MAKLGKAPVTMRAIIQRINRKLKSENEMLKATRGERMLLECGPFYIVDFGINAVMRKDVDPESVARKLGVLKPWEAVVK